MQHGFYLQFLFFPDTLECLTSSEDVITSYKKQVEHSTEYIEINRMQLSMLRQLMKMYKNAKSNLKKMPDITFSGEHGADMGGPTKEFFHKAISSLTRMDPLFNIQLFGGKQGHLVPICGVDAVASGCFEMAVKLVAHSILHDGPGFVGLSPAVVSYLATGSLEAAKESVSTNDLLDIELKKLLDEDVRSFYHRSML